MIFKVYLISYEIDSAYDGVAARNFSQPNFHYSDPFERTSQMAQIPPYNLNSSIIFNHQSGTFSAAPSHSHSRNGLFSDNISKPLSSPLKSNLEFTSDVGKGMKILNIYFKILIGLKNISEIYSTYLVDSIHPNSSSNRLINNGAKYFNNNRIYTQNNDLNVDDNFNEDDIQDSSRFNNFNTNNFNNRSIHQNNDNDNVSNQNNNRYNNNNQNSNQNSNRSNKQINDQTNNRNDRNNLQNHDHYANQNNRNHQMIINKHPIPNQQNIDQNNNNYQMSNNKYQIPPNYQNTNNNQNYNYNQFNNNTNANSNKNPMSNQQNTNNIGFDSKKN